MLEIEYEVFSRYFYYDPSSPSCLRWKVDRFAGRWKKVLRAAKDSPAGHLHVASGYYKITLDGVDYMAHRVVYCLVHGSVDSTMDVDHEDGDTTNNISSNLRCIPHRANTQNTKHRSTNKSGVKGVHRKTKTNKVGTQFHYWLATWMSADGKVKEKAFSVIQHGDEEARRLASQYRVAKIAELVKSGQSYTDRHQTSK